MTRHRYTVSALLIVLMASAEFEAKGQNSSAKVDTLLNINQITVVGSRTNRQTTPVQTLSGKQLTNLNVLSVADAVRYFAGVQIKDYGGVGGLKTVNIRSMGSQHTGVFYDGVEIGNAQNGVIDLGRFALDNMEAVSVCNGQKSDLLQTARDYASASALYMRTLTPTFESGKRNNLNVGFKCGSFDTANPTIRWDHRINNSLSSSLSAEYLYTSGRYRFSYAKKDGYDTTEVRLNGDVRVMRVEGGLFGTIKGGEWRAKCYFYDSERGYPGASVREEPGKFRHQDRQWDDNVFVQGSLRKVVCDTYTLQLNAKYSFDYLHYRSDPRLDVTTMYVDNRYRQSEGYLSAAHLLRLTDWWYASLANDVQLNTLDADLVDFVYPTRLSVLSALTTSIDTEPFKLQANILHTFVDDRVRTDAAGAGRKSIFTLSVVATVKPFADHDLRLRAFYKRIFRMPTLNDLYYTFIGNKELKPEYTDQYNVGITYSLPNTGATFRSLQLQTDVYYNQVENKIVAMPTSNQFRWTMLNLGYVEIRGIDVSVESSVALGSITLSPRISYTFQRAQDFTDRQSEWYGGQIPYIPWYSCSVIVGGECGEWSWNYSFIYTGERYEAVANIPENYAQPWYTHDCSVSRTLRLGKTSLRLTAELNNIFNQQYEVVQCYPMPGTNFKLKINFLL